MHGFCPVVVLLLVTAAGEVRAAARAARSVQALGSRPVDSLLVEQHNAFRQEERASNIYKMHWNESVARAAERWVSRCDFRHEMTGEYGENLYYDSNAGEDKELLLSGLEAWHEEKRGWRYSSAACGTACHYTQMVWSSTTSVGCSYKRCPSLTVGNRRVDDAIYLVCFYYPRGNWIGEYPFKPGSPCSNCGSDTCQDGLCVDPTLSGSQVSWQLSYKHQSHQSQYTSQNTWHRKSELRYAGSASSTAGGRRTTSRDSLSLSRSHHSSASNRHQESHRLAEFRRAESLRAHGARQQNEITPYGTQRAYTIRQQNNEISQLHAERTYTAQHRSEAADYRSHRTQTTRQQNEVTDYNRDRTRGSRRQNEVLQHGPRQQNSLRRSDTTWSRTAERQRDARQRSVRRGQSPLELLREETHWCRDRLPSCRRWTRKCLKSKAVYLSCPRTCGQCDADDATSSPSDADNTFYSEPSTTARSRPPQREVAQLRQRQQGHTGRRQQPRQRKQDPARTHNQRQHQRQRQQEEKSRRRRPGGRGSRGGRKSYHPRYKMVDRRAETLAQTMRRRTSNGRCIDDEKYKDSCDFWVAKGFCHNNELVSNVYCKKSCGTCS